MTNQTQNSTKKQTNDHFPEWLSLINLAAGTDIKEIWIEKFWDDGRIDLRVKPKEFSGTVRGRVSKAVGRSIPAGYAVVTVVSPEARTDIPMMKGCKRPLNRDYYVFEIKPGQ